MNQRMMVRSVSVMLLSLALLAAPAFAAGPERPADGARSGWLIQLDDLLSRAVELILGDRLGDEERNPASDDGKGLRSTSGTNECDAECEGRGGIDPNG